MQMTIVIGRVKEIGLIMIRPFHLEQVYSIDCNRVIIFRMFISFKKLVTDKCIACKLSKIYLSSFEKQLGKGLELDPTDNTPTYRIQCGYKLTTIRSFWYDT